MAGDAALGGEEVVILDEGVAGGADSGCLSWGCTTYAMPGLFYVGAYFARSSWHVVTGADTIFGDSRALDVAVGLAFIAASALFMGVSAILFVSGVWKTKMKFYERGLSLHGMGAWGWGKSKILYDEIARVRVSEKHNVTPKPRPGGAGVRREYEYTEYTFAFELKGRREPITFDIALDRRNREAEAIAERLKMEGVRVEPERPGKDAGGG